MSEQKIAKLKARVKKLEAERFQLFDDARYAGLLRRYIKEKQWGGVFMVMANYFGADHIGIPPDMQEVMAENKRLQQQVSRLEFANRDRIHDINQLGGYMEENHRLKADVERLTAMANECEHLHKGIYSLSLDVLQLKDENARLRKAGDACSNEIENLNEDIGRYYPSSQKAVADWQAAKEGKQS